MPILYRNILEVNGEKATDGGMADSIPVREAYRRGATDITVIRSRSADYVKKESPIALAIFSLYFRKYPRLVEKFRKRAENYNASVQFIHNPPQGVRITEIAPPANLEIGRTTRDEAPLRAAYETGIAHGNQISFSPHSHIRKQLITLQNAKTHRLSHVINKMLSNGNGHMEKILLAIFLILFVGRISLALYFAAAQY